MSSHAYRPGGMLSTEMFLDVYMLIKSDLLHVDSAFEFDDLSRHWVEKTMDYNVPGGKLNRGLTVVDCFKLLNGSELVTDDELFLVSVLGWCVEWFQASCLVLDDIMDDSHTRRGQPCWFRVPHVGIKALNGGVLLANQITRIIKHYFKGKPYYIHLIDLFNEVAFQTTSGQMIDLITTHEGEKDLNKYTFDRYRRIVQYKTAYYSFYLPVGVALVMLGENMDKHSDTKKILVDMGIYFQVQDDFLDCYGDPAIMGKIGTDIEDFKCSWLIVKALELCNDEQRKLLFESYGKHDQVCVEKVKKLYTELKLEDVFDEYESGSYEKLCQAIDLHQSKSIQAILSSFLMKIYKRHK